MSKTLTVLQPLTLVDPKARIEIDPTDGSVSISLSVQCRTRGVAHDPQPKLGRPRCTFCHGTGRVESNVAPENVHETFGADGADRILEALSSIAVRIGKGRSDAAGAEPAGTAS